MNPRCADLNSHIRRSSYEHGIRAPEHENSNREPKIGHDLQEGDEEIITSVEAWKEAKKTLKRTRPPGEAAPQLLQITGRDPNEIQVAPSGPITRRTRGSRSCFSSFDEPLEGEGVLGFCFTGVLPRNFARQRVSKSGCQVLEGHPFRRGHNDRPCPFEIGDFSFSNGAPSCFASPVTLGLPPARPITEQANKSVHQGGGGWGA